MEPKGNGSFEANQPRRSDPGWKYCRLKDKTKPNSVTCNFCHKTTNGGIFRAKEHLVGESRNATACDKCPESVKEELKSYMQSQKAKKTPVFDNYVDLDLEQGGFGEDEDVDNIAHEIASAPKRSGQNLQIGGSSKSKSNVKGPLDLLYAKAKGNAPLRQTSIKESNKELRDLTVQTIARFFYQAGVAFNSARLDSFKEMVQVIRVYGPNLKPPSFHELREPLLRKEVNITKDSMKDYKDEWLRYGCSIMSDGWTDRRHRTLINFLVNCAKGTMFVGSVDASSYTKTGSKLFELLDSFVAQIGEANVVQVITDNGSNFVQAGKFLMANRPHLFWTPCAAHCLDLMLEDIGKITKVRNTIRRGICLVGFIYNHSSALNMMREFTNGKELARQGVTHFATTFLTLQSLQKHKAHLRQMFTSEKWTKSKLATDPKGRRASDIVFMQNFWNNVMWTLKVMNPIVQVLRLVDNEKKPAMGYIYEAMDRAREAIAKAFEGKEEEYKEVFEIIDRRWDCQLHHPLHAAGYYFNPEFYCTNKDIETDSEVIKGVLACLH